MNEEIERLKEAGDKLREILGRNLIDNETRKAFDEWEAAVDAVDDAVDATKKYFPYTPKDKALGIGAARVTAGISAMQESCATENKPIPELGQARTVEEAQEIIRKWWDTK